MAGVIGTSGTVNTLVAMAINIPTVLLRFLAKYWVHDENAAARWLLTEAQLKQVAQLILSRE